MIKYKSKLAGLLLIGVSACTSLSEGGNADLPPDPSHNRRVRYSDNREADLRRQMNEQSSEINRKRNIEEPTQNDPAMTPPALRPRQAPNAPVDTVRHNMPQPLRTRRTGNQ